MRWFYELINVYRVTFKRVPGFHKAMYFIGQWAVLPILERWKNFHTVPDDPLNFRLELILGKYEHETVSFFKQYLKQGMTVLDVGAHIGYYTRLFADLVGPSGLVVAFEPHPVHFKLLQQNLRDYHNVCLVNKAVGDREGKTTLYNSPVESVSSSLQWFDKKWQYVRSRNKGEIAPRLKWPQSISYDVDLTVLDKQLQELNIAQIDVIKIDIEGAEIPALSGGVQTAKKSELVIFELDPQNLRGFGYAPDDLIDMLNNLGFNWFGMITNNGFDELILERLRELITDLEEKYSRINCVAAKRKFL